MVDEHIPAVFFDIKGRGYRVACTCGWWTSERVFKARSGASGAHCSHAARQAAPPRCPHCGDFRWSDGTLVDPPACADLKVAGYHEVLCDQPWAEWECLRCELRFAQDEAAGVSNWMLTAATS